MPPESAAKALFGDQDPINQLVKLNNRDELKVTGLLKDLPKNSSFEFDCLLPWKLYEKQEWVKNQKDNWGNYSFQVYVELNEPSKKTTVESKIKDLLTRHGEKDFLKELFLHPMSSWRLHSHFFCPSF